MHYFRRSFLEAVALRLHDEGRFHIAKKQIPSLHGPVQVLSHLSLCSTVTSAALLTPVFAAWPGCAE